VEKVKSKEDEKLSNLGNTADRLRRTTARRRTDRETSEDIEKIVGSKCDPSVLIEKVNTVLKQHKTLSSILDEHTVDRVSGIGKRRVSAPVTREVLAAGTPAMYLTHGDLIRKRKERE